MGCPDTTAIGWPLEFSIITHDSFNAPVDADALPTYVIYENSDDDTMASGTMELLAGNDTTGAYRARLTITSALGFELLKSYQILITAVISGSTFEKIYTFQVRALAVEAPAAEEDPDTLAESILANAQGPQSASADGQSAAQHSLPDQIAADQYLKSKDVAGSPASALRTYQIVSPGIV